MSLRWVSTLVSFDSAADGSDQRHISYTVTNDGPDDVVAKVAANLHLVVTVDSADWASTLAIEGTSSNAQAVSNSARTVDETSGQVTYTFDVTLTATEGVAEGQAMSLNIYLTYGYLAGTSGDLGHPEESMTMTSPQIVLASDGCTTTNVVGSIDGSSDGTTWGYPG